MNIKKILEDHLLWLENNSTGAPADLIGKDLVAVDLSGINLRRASLIKTNLKGANLNGTNLNEANLIKADLKNANLTNADLGFADLRGADLVGANLSNTNLNGANLSSSNLNGANLSSAIGLLDPIDFLSKFKRTNNGGLIAYKCFDGTFVPNKNWEIKTGSIIKENVNQNPTDECGCGINVADLAWVKKHYHGPRTEFTYRKSDINQYQDIYEIIIPLEALCTIVVPYNTDGKFRCGMAIIGERIA